MKGLPVGAGKIVVLASCGMLLAEMAGNMVVWLAWCSRKKILGQRWLGGSRPQPPIGEDLESQLCGVAKAFE